MARRRGEHAPPAPGVVKVRLTGDTFSSDVLVQILRDHPSVEILTGPDKYDGDRQYLLVQVASPAGILARLGKAPDVASGAPGPGPHASRDNGEPPRLRRLRQLPLDDEEDW